MTGRILVLLSLGALEAKSMHLEPHSVKSTEALQVPDVRFREIQTHAVYDRSWRVAAPRQMAATGESRRAVILTNM